MPGVVVADVLAMVLASVLGVLMLEAAECAETPRERAPREIRRSRPGVLGADECADPHPPDTENTRPWRDARRESRRAWRTAFRTSASALGVDQPSDAAAMSTTGSIVGIGDASQRDAATWRDGRRLGAWSGFRSPRLIDTCFLPLAPPLAPPLLAADSMGEVVNEVVGTGGGVEKSCTPSDVSALGTQRP